MMRTHLTQRVAASFGLAAAFRFSSTGAKLPSELFAAPHDAYARRHIGPTPQETRDMLAAIDPSLQTVDQLMDRVVPKNIRRTPMTDVAAMTEAEALSNLRRLMMRNKLRKSLLGQGYYEALVPPAIQRNVLENPAWYTPYTPYQAEISQGRLESLLNFQTAVMDLTGMTIANASLLDEATAAVEAIISSLNLLKSKRSKREKIFVDKRCFEATIEMIRTRVHNIYAQVVVGDLATELDVNDENLAVVMVQTPDRFGAVHDFSTLFEKVKANGGMACCGTDLLACSLIKPPGEMGADFVFGNAQRLGVPLGFGGPHPAFFAAREAHKRFLPGRLVGVSIDSKGRRALRLALQTREQHIKRQNATSNICTAQALLANMAAMYCVYHGPDGLKEIATRVHEAARTYALGMEVAGHTVLNRDSFFDTITVKLDDAITADEYLARCEDRRINVWRVSANTVTVAFDEATTNEHLIALLECGGIVRPRLEAIAEQAATRGGQTGIPEGLKRTSKYLTQDVFHKNRCETELMRYIWRLCRKDYGLEHGMVPLGSCTMKLNPAASMLPMSWQRVTALHPFVPADQAEGYKILAVELSEKLKMVSGLDAVSLQPNSGAQGEYAGLRVIRAFQASIGEGSRDIALIPANAHGTNPASAALCGLKCVIVKCLPDGSIDMAHLQQLCDKHKSEISCAMITYPSTYGIFDNQISTITSMVHSIGAQVYIDGANFNAMVGHTGPGFFGGDVCHFNLHKTFSIPHGGGGPGMGPIACKEHLAPFLPDCVHSHALNVGGANAFGQCSQGPLGSAAILTISYMLISMLGTAGMKQCTDFAVLAANYMMSALKEDYSVRFLAKDSGLCAHEFILDMAPFGKVDIKAEDVAKRLMDYGFHAPTLAFPVNNTLMVEPTESEPKAELDRFVTAMKSIRREIRLIEEGKLPKDLNMLKLAPHPADDVISSKWDLPYTREQAAFPVGTEAQLGVPKYWPMTSRINNEHGDQNLFCSCAPVTPAE